MGSENQFISVFLFAFSVTVPIFAIVLLGVVLKRVGLITDDFTQVASNLVFNIGLPVMLFTNSVKSDFSQLVNLRLVVVLVATTLLVFFLSWIVARFHVSDARDRGIYVQGSFRGNLIVVGLAFCANAYGAAGLATATLPTAMLVIVYNVLSVYILNVTLNQGGGHFAGTVAGILKNPLIIAIVAGLMANASGLRVPDLVIDTGAYLSRMTLPLALLCIGGSLDFHLLRRSGTSALTASFWKLIVSPVVVCLIAIPFGVRDDELGVLFLLAAAPTAAASFIMARAMGGNSGMAANIVLLSTACSIVTVTGGLSFLKFSGLI